MKKKIPWWALLLLSALTFALHDEPVGFNPLHILFFPIYYFWLFVSFVFFCMGVASGISEGVEKIRGRKNTESAE